jgi:hypothetical protein
MKKRMLAFLLVLLLILLSACGAASSAADKAPMTTAAPAAAGEDMLYSSYSGGNTDGNTDGSAAASGALDKEKIIYSADARVESLDFDASVASVYDLIDRTGSFLESSEVAGNNYSSSGYKSGRTANFVIRVPRESFQELTDSLSTLGNVPYRKIYTENITADYFDTESRLNAYRTEEERLLAMLEKAETVEDMLNIEDRLSQVRYNIESLTSTLMNWDSLISYSTVTLQITEVSDYTENTPVQQTYWQKIVDAFGGSLEGIASFFKWLLIALIAILPILVVVGIILAVVFLIRHSIRKKRGLPPSSRPRRHRRDIGGPPSPPQG